MKNTCIKTFVSILICVILILLDSVPLKSQETHFASGWTVNNNADWTPFPNSGNPLGSGTNDCTGGTNSNGWAEFTFPAFTSSGSITGIELCVKYLSASGTNEAELRKSNMSLGNKILPVQTGTSACSSTVENCVGGTGDTWSSGLTSPSGVSVRINQNANTIEIDYVKLTIWFSGDNSDPDCSGASIADQSANASCEAAISGDDVMGITDPDGDPLTISVDPTTLLLLGPNPVTVSANDGNGGTCNIDINVNVVDDSAPLPDVPILDDAVGQCSVTLTPPTATDNCAGSITATTDDPTTYLDQGTFTVTWTYDDGNGNSIDQEQDVIVDDVTPPVPDLAILPDAVGECSVTVTPPTATDNCAGSITGTTDDPTTYLDQGTFTVTWTYDDGNGNSIDQEQDVIVDDVTPPVPDLAILPDAVGECSVTVTPPTATDNCEGSITATTDDPTTYLDQGTFTVTWTYDDGNGNSIDQEQDVIVDDVTPPVITTIGNVIVLWPPNHKYTTINIADCVTAVSDNCNMDLTIGDVKIAQVSSDEPENVKGKGGGGDGNTMNDILFGDDCESVELRAERQGKGNGRVYTIHFSLDDGNGNTGTAMCQVSVPHDQSGVPATDDGAGAGYTEQCSGSPGLRRDFEVAVYESISFQDFVLEQNHPNPFRVNTYINFAVPELTDVNLTIYNLRGQIIRTLYSGSIDAGQHSVEWDGTDFLGALVDSGIYVYKLQAEDFIAFKKLILIN